MFGKMSLGVVRIALPQEKHHQSNHIECVPETKREADDTHGLFFRGSWPPVVWVLTDYTTVALRLMVESYFGSLSQRRRRRGQGAPTLSGRFA